MRPPLIDVACRLGSYRVISQSSWKSLSFPNISVTSVELKEGS